MPTNFNTLPNRNIYQPTINTSTVFNPVKKETAQQPQTEKGISKKALVGIGASLAAAATVGILLAKGNFRQAKQLAEHIDFKEAKTMDEAVQFAKENLGVKLQIGDNLDVANFLNEIFVDVNNKMKGKAVLPKKVKMQATNATDGLEGFASWNTKRVLKLGSDFEAIVNIGKEKGLTLKECIEYYKEFSKDKDPNFITRAIYHELGHANHKNFMKMRRLPELKADGNKDTHLTEEFLQDVKDNKVVHDFFDKNTSTRLDDGTIYSLSSPAEFVADTFSFKMLGKSIPEEVEKIYQKFGGPVIG